MSEKKWIGLIPTVKRFLYGYRPPKLKRHSSTSTPTTSKSYEGMHEDYRWFRQDELVRRCIVVNALFATMTAGFETELEPTGDVENKDAVIKEYGYVKETVDAYNKRVNMDKVLFVTQVKRSIYGKAGWEIVLEQDNTPSWLLSLQSPKLKPKLDENWELVNFTYEGKDNAYDIEEVFYFTNLQLESDREGLSDIEPIRDICKARHDLLRKDFPEIVRTLWAPYVILQADTIGMTDTNEDKYLQDLLEHARSGKSLATNKSVEATVVKADINLTGLVALLDKLEEAMMREFGTPRFLLGKPIENRATAFAELEAYVQGPIAFIQRYLKREVEAQWYDMWTRKILEAHGKRFGEGEELPVLVKHKWNPIRVTDVYEMAKAVSFLHGRGTGILAEYPDLSFEMMGWPKEVLEEKQEEQKGE